MGVGAVRCFCVATIYPSLHGESLTTTLRRKGCRCSSVEKSLLSVAKSLSLIPEFAKNKRLKMGGGVVEEVEAGRQERGVKKTKLCIHFAINPKLCILISKKKISFLRYIFT